VTRAKRMKPVQNLFDDTERRLATGLATIERKVADAEAKLQELERYRSDYDKQFAQRAGVGIGATSLRDYQVFLARLSEAIRQQQAVVKRAQSERDAERHRWQEAAKRAKALGPAMSCSRRLPPMPSFSTASPAVLRSASSRAASTSGQRELVSSVECAPSVMLSPNATIAPPFALASTSTPFTKRHDANLLAPSSALSAT